MSKAVSASLSLLFFLSVSHPAVADDYSDIKKYCNWKSSAAQTIALNRDIGLNETEITKHYLKQDTAYNEQVIVLGLIDKIYGTYEYVTHDTIYTQTNKTCLRELYAGKSSEVLLSRSMDSRY